MKISLPALLCPLLFVVILSACAGQKKSAYAPIIPPPTFQVDPALLSSPAATDAPPAQSGNTKTPEANTPVTE
ncbi:MAG: hypothetical protein LBQ75_02305 [Zoogloeaceae bacterium]|jgi:hypothetical protein|nr:hypothetical protein [Zoogloeaceae bacterium]